MADIPTIRQIYETLSNDLRNRLNLSDDDLKQVLDAVNISLSGQLKLVYLRIGDIQNNIFPDTADTEFNGGTLERQGRIHLNRNRRPSTSGIFEVSVIAEDGSTLRQGITFKSNDDSKNAGNLYILDEEQNLTGVIEDDVIEIRSLKGGTEMLLDVGDTLTITEPVIGVEKIVTVTAIIEQPLSAEDVEEYRKDILDSIQLEPQGGAKTDYRLWAADAQGVRLVFPFVKISSAGTVEVYIEATEADSSDGLGTPTATILAEVAEVIEFDPDTTIDTNSRGRRPIQATIEVLPVVPVPIDVTITNIDENSTDITEALRANLKEYLRNIRPYVAGADLARNKSDILYSARLGAVCYRCFNSF